MIAKAEDFFLGLEEFGGGGGEMEREVEVTGEVSARVGGLATVRPSEVELMEQGLEETTWSGDPITSILELAKTVSGSGAGMSGARTNLADLVKELQQRIVKLEVASQKRTYADHKMLSRIREELDQANNMRKEDRIIIMGLHSDVPMPSAEV